MDEREEREVPECEWCGEHVFSPCNKDESAECVLASCIKARNEQPPRMEFTAVIPKSSWGKALDAEVVSGQKALPAGADKDEFDAAVLSLPAGGGSMGVKPTNPKDAVGIKKVPMSVLSGPVLSEVALGCMEGAMKYGRHNWRAAGIRFSVYYDATMRHLLQWWEGEDLDPDSNLSHITKAICSLMVLRDAMIHGMATDDRPPKTHAAWMTQMNEVAAQLVDKYPTPVPAITEHTNGNV